MSAEMDPTEVYLLFEGAKELAPKVMELWGADFWSESVQEANIRKGTLRGSIQATLESDYMWIVGTNLEYAPYVHDGTQPHMIMGNPWLSWPGADHPVRKVMHPGYGGNPWFNTAGETTTGRLEEYLNIAMEGLE